MACRGNCGCPTRNLSPKVPEAILFAPIEENIPLLKEWILKRSKSFSFNVVNEAIDRDVSLGVFEWVPMDTPTTWC